MSTTAEDEKESLPEDEPIRVVLFDDYGMDRATLRLFLEGRNCEVFEPVPGEDDTDVVRRVRPQVVVCDITDPGKYGFEAIAEIREAHAEARIVAITGAASAESSEFHRLVRRLGADGVLDKPFTPENVLKTISRVLAGCEDGPWEAPARPKPASRTDGVSLSQVTRRLEFAYRPLWDVKRKALSTYLCVPTRPVYSEFINCDRELPLTAAQGAAVAELDCLALRKVISDLELQRQAECRALLGCTVHFNTLREPSHRARYLSICRTIGPAIKNHLIFEIVLSSDDIQYLRAVDARCALESMCRAKVVRLPTNRTSFVALAQMRIHAVGVDLTDSTASEQHLYYDLEKFAADARRTGFRTIARGLGSMNLISAALCARFDYLDGDAVRCITDTPDRVSRFDVEDLVPDANVPRLS